MVVARVSARKSAALNPRPSPNRRQTGQNSCRCPPCALSFPRRRHSSSPRRGARGPGPAPGPSQGLGPSCQGRASAVRGKVPPPGDKHGEGDCFVYLGMRVLAWLISPSKALQAVFRRAVRCTPDQMQVRLVLLVPPAAGPPDLLQSQT